MKKTILSAGICAMMLLASCAGNTSGDNATDTTAAAEQDAAVENDAFYATQPVHSGIYVADHYDISGDNARKGSFDGRIIFTLSPESTSAFYVYENGNRTKIDYKVVLKHPFEKGDSGIYRSVDVNGLPVTINTDSTEYCLAFNKNNADVRIEFGSKPKSESNAFEALEDINKAASRK